MLRKTTGANECKTTYATVVMPHSAIGLAPPNAVFRREIYTQLPNYFPLADDDERVKTKQIAVKTVLRCPP